MSRTCRAGAVGRPSMQPSLSASSASSRTCRQAAGVRRQRRQHQWSAEPEGGEGRQLQPRVHASSRERPCNS
eukprot:352791-Chlamydomonas_euryale.AAC.11